MSHTSKNRLFIALAFLAILLIGGLFLFRDKETGGPREEDISEAEGDEITVSGVISCLPYYVNIAGQSCVKALQGDDGKMYALNTLKVRGIENTMPEGAKVTAIGIFEPADKSVDDSSVFDYDGVLVVRSLIRR